MPFIDGDSSTTPAKHADAKNHLSFPVMPNMQRRVCQSSDPLPIHPTSSDRSLLVRHPCELPSTTYRSALVPNFFLLFAVAVRHLPVVVIVHAIVGATGSSIFLQLSQFISAAVPLLPTVNDGAEDTWKPQNNQRSRTAHGSSMHRWFIPHGDMWSVALRSQW